jgi:hypothetical protein
MQREAMSSMRLRLVQGISWQALRLADRRDVLAPLILSLAAHGLLLPYRDRQAISDGHATA